MKKIERSVILKRNRLMRSGRIIFERAIREQYQQAINEIERTSLEQIPEAIRTAITIDPIDRVFAPYYSGAVEIAMAWRKYHLTGQKADEQLYYTRFRQSLYQYGVKVGKKRIRDITTTTEEHIVKLSQELITRGLEDGLGIAKVRDMLIDAVNEQYAQITKARANLIAQTEMVAAANEATMQGTESLGLEYRKFWSTSGIGNSRDSHIEAENDSVARGGLEKDEPFSNGLQFPGDPDGSPEEVCNCHCTLLTEII